MGGVYTDIKAPLMVDFNNTSLGSRTGTASTKYLHIPLFGSWSFAWEDASIDAAAKQGNIKTVKHADYRMMQILGIYGEFTTIVYGD